MDIKVKTIVLVKRSINNVVEFQSLDFDEAMFDATHLQNYQFISTVINQGLAADGLPTVTANELADNVSSMTVYGRPSREDFIDSLAQTVVRVYISRRKVEILRLQSEIDDLESTIS